MGLGVSPIKGYRSSNKSLKVHHVTQPTTLTNLPSLPFAVAAPLLLLLLLALVLLLLLAGQDGAVLGLGSSPLRQGVVVLAAAVVVVASGSGFTSVEGTSMYISSSHSMVMTTAH